MARLVTALDDSGSARARLDAAVGPLGFTPPSTRIPGPAFQVVVLLLAQLGS